MKEYLFRPSSIGKLMSEPKSKSEGPLSVGAKSYLREIATQDIFGVDFEITSKYMDKGIRCEDNSIDLLNQVIGTSLSKNTERRKDDFLTGECDLFDFDTRIGYDLKTSWSLQTFPAFEIDCTDKIYEYQMRSYMRLWDAQKWVVAYAMVDTPEDLIRFEPMELHIVSHIPPEHRITMWTITRDMEIEAKMVEKMRHARDYLKELYHEFERTHKRKDVIDMDTGVILSMPQEPPQKMIDLGSVDF